MPFQAVPLCRSVVVNGTQGDGDPWAMVFHRDQAADLDQATADADGTFFLTEFWNPLIGAFHTSTLMTSVVCTDLRTEGAPQFTATTVSNVPGTDTHVPLAPQTAAMISWRTALRSRSGRGRTYMPPMTANVSDGGVTAGMIALVAEFIADVVGLADFNIVSRYSGTDKTIPGHRPKPIPRLGGAIKNHILSGTCEARWRTQRRRQVQ